MALQIFGSSTEAVTWQRFVKFSGDCAQLLYVGVNGVDCQHNVTKADIQELLKTKKGEQEVSSSSLSTVYNFHFHFGFSFWQRNAAVRAAKGYEKCRRCGLV